MKYKLDQKEIRVYHKENSCIFKKNNEEFGALSNMATGFPLRVNGVDIRTTEALYQACRFPHLPEIQEKILEQKSPMLVKMISNTNKKKSREDWDNVRLKVMKWCINIKLAQNFVSFGVALHETGLKNIVENSAKDNFWGAIPNEDETIFTGKNALGRLLMDLRQAFYSKDIYSLLFIEPPQISNFLLFHEPIGIIDERQNFLASLQNYWKGSYSNGSTVQTQMETVEVRKQEPEYVTRESKMNVEEQSHEYETATKTKTKRQSKKKKADTTSQQNLFNNF
ncbi:MAG: NADAR family protein [Verrucomicrobia bacterium]|nr:NADAR family protein [Verrucomicrobiota bacterium]